MDRHNYVYDIEVFPNFFSISYLNTSTTDRGSMYLYTEQNGNTLAEITSFLDEKVAGMIGYNNLKYDYPVLHGLYNAARNILDPDPAEVCKIIYEISKEVFTQEYSQIPDYKVRWPQLDLFAIHHFDNPAKRTSLKALEIVMKWKNVLDYDAGFDTPVTENQLADILAYNMNDVEATYEFYLQSAGEIELRKQLTREYGINLLNANDPKIGAEIFAKLMSSRLQIPIKDLRKLRTYRQAIKVADLILPTVRFETPKYRSLLGNIRQEVITQTKGALENTLRFKDFQLDFGQGGIHGCTLAGVYQSSEESVICSCDVASLYPSIAINNGFYPLHLGPEFVNVYRDIRDQRLVAKRSGNKIKDLGLKLSINGVYGKSNDQYSFLYDPQFTMSITVNGQLLLAMLCERLQQIGCTLLMVNTDGIECSVLRSSLDRYHQLCCDWVSETGLELEHSTYDKLILRDVNNYIGILGEKVKLKGAFEIDKAWHKDPSSKVVAKAILNYFKTGQDIDSFIRSHEDIHDFCNRFKANSGWHSEVRYLDGDKVAILPQQKTNRYYMSSIKKNRYYKVHQDGREQLIEATGFVTLFNTFYEADDYHLDYGYYIRQAEKILHEVVSKQLTLF